jgi:hypothetical protein
MACPGWPGQAREVLASERWMTRGKLVRELFEGPIDIVGDVHGEAVALRALLTRLGYDDEGGHPEGRRLVFVGDLADRGPDSPGVVLLVRSLVRKGRAQAVMGNHELNALRARAGARLKAEHCWLFPQAPTFRHDGRPVPQKPAGRSARDILDFFDTLPLVLERAGDEAVRVVHASWSDEFVGALRHEEDAVSVFRRAEEQIRGEAEKVPGIDEEGRELLLQNRNPIKLLTSGHEARSATPIMINGKERYRVRTPWWNHYGGPLTVVGHYWRVPMPGDQSGDHLFDGKPHNALLGPGTVMCVDYSVGRRFRERLEPGFRGAYRSHLGALRLPERVLYFDNAVPQPLIG